MTQFPCYVNWCFLDRFTRIREARGSNPFHGFIRNQLNNQLSVTLLDQLAMRALHLYQRGQGFESLSRLFEFPQKRFFPVRQIMKSIKSSRSDN